MAEGINAGSDDKRNKRSQWRTLKTLGAYLWPKGRADLKLRVGLALGTLALAKVINVYVPFLYKRVIDSLSVESVVSIDVVRDLIPRLLKSGAQGIIEYPLNKAL